jgi:hypothetical protein
MKPVPIHSTPVYLTAVLVACIFGSCIFSPKSDHDNPNPPGKWETPTTPDKVISNLKLSFDDLNAEFYRDCLHSNYFYLSRSEIDNQDIRWSKSEDVRVIENLMKGTTKFVFTAVENSRIEEYGKDYSDIPEGAVVVPEHPTEKWLVINYTVDMEIFTREKGDLNVHQFMDFKFYQDPDSKLWSIILWNDLTNQ